MNIKFKKNIITFLMGIVFLIFNLFGCTDIDNNSRTSFSDLNTTSIISLNTTIQDNKLSIDESGYYYSKDEVALYIYTFGKLPNNFVTKKEAQDAGWSGGSVEEFFPEKCIGGDRFGNYEGILPDKNGRTWKECDIDTLGKSSRGAKRIVFSNDRLIYYTDDHYNTFTKLY